MFKDGVFILDEKDNVATVVNKQISEGSVVDLPNGDTIEIKNDIDFGHKFAIENIEQGDIIYKYGYSIGQATVNIEKGEHVHDHNIEPRRARGDKN